MATTTMTTKSPHAWNTLAAAIFGSVAVGLLAGAGSSCSFLEIVAKNVTLTVTEEWPPETFTSSTTSSQQGVFCDAGYYDLTSDPMWQLSRGFLGTSLALAIMSAILSWAISTVCTPSFRTWRGIAALSALSAVLQIPVFIIFEIEPCKAYPENQTCQMSTGSYLLVGAMLATISVTLITLCLNPPAPELDQWRLENVENVSRQRQKQKQQGPADIDTDSSMDNNTLNISAASPSDASFLSQTLRLCSSSRKQKEQQQQEQQQPDHPVGCEDEDEEQPKILAIRPIRDLEEGLVPHHLLDPPGGGGGEGENNLESTMMWEPFPSLFDKVIREEEQQQWERQQQWEEAEEGMMPITFVSATATAAAYVDEQQQQNPAAALATKLAEAKHAKSNNNSFAASALAAKLAEAKQEKFKKIFRDPLKRAAVSNDHDNRRGPARVSFEDDMNNNDKDATNDKTAETNYDNNTAQNSGNYKRVGDTRFQDGKKDPPGKVAREDRFFLERMMMRPSHSLHEVRAAGRRGGGGGLRGYALIDDDHHVGESSQQPKSSSFVSPPLEIFTILGKDASFENDDDDMDLGYGIATHEDGDDDDLGDYWRSIHDFPVFSTTVQTETEGGAEGGEVAKQQPQELWASDLLIPSQEPHELWVSDLLIPSQQPQELWASDLLFTPELLVTNKEVVMKEEEEEAKEIKRQEIIVAEVLRRRGRRMKKRRKKKKSPVGSVVSSPSLLDTTIEEETAEDLLESEVEKEDTSSFDPYTDNSLMRTYSAPNLSSPPVPGEAGAIIRSGERCKVYECVHMSGVNSYHLVETWRSEDSENGGPNFGGGRAPVFRKERSSSESFLSDPSELSRRARRARIQRLLQQNQILSKNKPRERSGPRTCGHHLATIGAGLDAVTPEETVRPLVDNIGDLQLIELMRPQGAEYGPDEASL